MTEETLDMLKQIRRCPHRLGRYLGYDRLTPLHSEWIRQLWDKPGSHALMAFRGSFKTTSCCILGIIRYLLFKPDARIFIIRKTFTDANSVIMAVSKMFEKREVNVLFTLAHGFGPRKIKDGGGIIDFNFKGTVTTEPSLKAFGITQSITGRHADVIIADDIIGLRDRTSRAERENVKEHIREIAGNVIDPGATLIFLGTKWARNDGWDTIGEFTEIKKYPLSKYNFFAPGEIEEKTSRLTPFLAAINYELEITADESLLFQNPRRGGAWQDTRQAVAQLDTAFDGSHYCALTIAAPVRKDGNDQYYQAAGFIYAGNVEDWEPEIEGLCEKYRVKTLYVEKNADKGACAKRLQKRGLNAVSYTESMNKAVKISTYLYQAWRFIEWAPETRDEYLEQILDWKEGGEPDDAPDSAASLFRLAFLDKTRAELSRDDIEFFHRRA
jgi:hypothetical protein